MEEDDDEARRAVARGALLLARRRHVERDGARDLRPRVVLLPKRRHGGRPTRTETSHSKARWRGSSPRWPARRARGSPDPHAGLSSVAAGDGEKGRRWSFARPGSGRSAHGGCHGPLLLLRAPLPPLLRVPPPSLPAFSPLLARRSSVTATPGRCALCPCSRKPAWRCAAAGAGREGRTGELCLGVGKQSMGWRREERERDRVGMATGWGKRDCGWVPAHGSWNEGEI
jgi:hypothetical protein